MRPPAKVHQSEITKAARRVERLKLRLRAEQKRARHTEGEIREAKRILRQLVDDLWPEVAGPVGEELLPGEEP